MSFVVSSRTIRTTGALAAVLGLVGSQESPIGPSSARAQSAQAAVSASQVSAVYQIALNGFNIGSFSYTAAISGQSYTLNSEVDLSLLMGAFKWTGISHTTGQTGGTTSGPTGAASLKPATFGFDYTSTLKNGAVRMGFNKGSVDSVSIDPPAPLIPGIVPVKSEHLINVLDPLSAILALTQDNGGKPCDRKVAIFDGKQRFDLQLVFRRQELQEGSTEPVSVCRVKYIPIAGYRPTEETANLAKSTGIEISFRSVPDAKLQVPHKVVLPTLAGTAEISIERVQINTPGAGQVALVNE